MPGDDGAERTNSTISEVLEINYTIHADCYASFVRLESNEIDALDILEFEEKKDKCIGKNV